METMVVKEAAKDFLSGVVKASEKARLGDRETILLSVLLLVAWWGMVLLGKAEPDPFIRMIELYLYGVGGYKAMSWQAK